MKRYNEVLKNESFINNLTDEKIIYDIRYDQNNLIKIRLLIDYLKMYKKEKMNVNIITTILAKSILEDYKYTNPIFQNIDKCTSYIKLDLDSRKFYYDKYENQNIYKNFGSIDDKLDCYGFANYLLELCNNGPYIFITLTTKYKNDIHETILVLENRNLLKISSNYNYFGMYYDPSGTLNNPFMKDIYTFLENIIFIKNKISKNKINFIDVSNKIGIQRELQYDIGFCQTYIIYWFHKLFEKIINNLSNSILKSIEDYVNIEKEIYNYNNKEDIYSFIVNYADFLIELYNKYYPEDVNKIQQYRDSYYTIFFETYKEKVPKIKNIIKNLNKDTKNQDNKEMDY